MLNTIQSIVLLETGTVIMMRNEILNRGCGVGRALVVDSLMDEDTLMHLPTHM